MAPYQSFYGWFKPLYALATVQGSRALVAATRDAEFALDRSVLAQRGPPSAVARRVPSVAAAMLRLLPPIDARRRSFARARDTISS